VFAKKVDVHMVLEVLMQVCKLLAAVLQLAPPCT